SRVDHGINRGRFAIGAEDCDRSTPDRTGKARLAASEDCHQWDAERRSKVQKTGINADDKSGTGKQLCQPVQWRAGGNAGARHDSLNTFAARTLTLVAPWQHNLDVPAERPAKRDPVLLRPLLLRSRGCMQQHDITLRTARVVRELKP